MYYNYIMHHASASRPFPTLLRCAQMADEDPYKLPTIDESKWFIGGHLGSQIQSVNWQIVNCTTPANYFHVLRRQLHRQVGVPTMMSVMRPVNHQSNACCCSCHCRCC